jgi:hypothetical protein
MAVAANVPAGDNTVTASLNGIETSHMRSMEEGFWEFLVLYPRSEDQIPECAPGDIDDYTPEWKPSGGMAQGVCTDLQASDYINACRSSTSTTETCAAWVEDAQNTECYECAYVPWDAPNWNAIVEYLEVGFADGAGNQCISAFEGDLSENSCGAKLDAARFCALHSCKHNCPVRQHNFSADLAELNGCYADAIQTVCIDYADEANACAEGLIGEGDPIDQCLWAQGEDWIVWAERLIILMCGDGVVGP